MHTSYYAEYSLGAKILLVLFTALVGALFIDGGAFVFNSIFGLGNPLEGYRSLGRFLLNFLAGEARFPENNFAQLPAVAGELAAGLTLHYLIAVFDTLLYFYLSFQLLRSTPKLLPAVLLMLGLLFMPYCIAGPATGAGFFGSNTPDPAFTLLKSAVLHPVFGLGMFLGARAFDRLYARRQQQR
ncbi:MAG: DUF2938 family protein [Xanthomonadales bacterium]|nr:DUF2938 family protein [Xanthomonadales bacterium]